MGGDSKVPRETFRGYADAPPANEEVAEPSRVSALPFVEVELVYERGQLGIETEDWRAFEVWTQNHTYVTDWSMRCLAVIDRETGKAVHDHSLVGAYLAGGQRQDADHTEMTYPVPRPGTEAVFEYRGARKGFVNTSTVTRVVLRMRSLTVPHESAKPTWGKITAGKLRLPNWDD